MPDQSLLLAICRVAAETGSFASLNHLAAQGVVAAVRTHDTLALFDWLVDILSYQGVSDAIAWSYMDQHGRVCFSDIDQTLRTRPSCLRLTSDWHFDQCRFAKTAGTCAEPAHIQGCQKPPPMQILLEFSPALPKRDGFEALV
jgi:hypothetical protein